MHMGGMMQNKQILMTANHRHAGRFQSGIAAGPFSEHPDLAVASLFTAEELG